MAQGLPRWFSGKNKQTNSPTNAGDWVQSLGWQDPLEKKIATLSSILAWEIPWTEEPGGLQSMGLQESDTRATEHAAHALGVQGLTPNSQSRGLGSISSWGTRSYMPQLRVRALQLRPGIAK